MGQTINVYELVKTEWLHSNKDLILRILFEKSSNMGKFAINPTSGFIKYADPSVLFTSAKPSNLINEATKVVTHISSFIRNANIKLLNAAKNSLFQNPNGEKLKF